MSGAEWDRQVSVRQNSDDTLVFGYATGTLQDSTPIDFTGCVAELTVCKNAVSPSDIIIKVSGIHGVLPDDRTHSYMTFGTAIGEGVIFSTIEVHFVAADTVSIPPRTYYYDLLIIRTFGETVISKEYYALGEFIITPSVGRITGHNENP